MLYEQMAQITITPTWAKVMEFQTREPQAVLKLAQRHEEPRRPGPRER